MVVNAYAAAAARGFLTAPTPDDWVEAALARLPELLLDHANCELKAASTALGFIYRYAAESALADRMSRLAREELRHFEQVRRLIRSLYLPFRRLSASRYAGALRAAARPQEPGRRTDLLLVGALIEARSCERFAALVPGLPGPLSGFYAGLLAAEARHFEEYLALARQDRGDAFGRRLRELKELESSLITAPDPQFRFHSGPPAAGQGSSARVLTKAP
ncbi:MAG: tRNA-(ms[2]io[6]A)-hydroxylase [Woeseiaceae bacterium]